MARKTVKLADNPHVQELFSILKENDKDTAGLTALLSYVKQMEDFVKSAENQITDMKTQIGEIKEIQNHPVKSTLSSTAKSLEANVTGLRAQFDKIRESIVESCKNAVTAFKENGITALDKLAGFFHVKQGFEAIEKNTTAGMKRCDNSITKIETFSKEYHATGQHLKNMVRVAAGKERIKTPKKMGTLAKTMCKPYQDEKKSLDNIRTTANKAIARLDELGKTADEIRQERLSGKKPTVEERLAALEEKTKQKDESNVIPFSKTKPKARKKTPEVTL